MKDDLEKTFKNEESDELDEMINELEFDEFVKEIGKDYNNEPVSNK